MKPVSYHRCGSEHPSRQSGLALMVALIALAAMTLAGIALVRSIDTNALIAGNLAFRQNSTTSADAGVERARDWILKQNSAGLQNDNTGNGYYATRMHTGGGVDNQGVDITGSRTKSSIDNVKWIDASGDEQPGEYTPICEAANDATGNRVCYVIHRMCALTGKLEDSECNLTTSSNTAGNSLGSLQQNMTYQKTLVGSGNMMGNYRISVRVAGPRNNNSYVQVFIQR